MVFGVRYLVKFQLYNINGIMYFDCASQYRNWITVMEENFNQYFKVIEITTCL